MLPQSGTNWSILRRGGRLKATPLQTSFPLIDSDVRQLTSRLSHSERLMHRQWIPYALYCDSTAATTSISGTSASTASLSNTSTSPPVNDIPSHLVQAPSPHLTPCCSPASSHKDGRRKLPARKPSNQDSDIETQERQLYDAFSSTVEQG